MSDKPGKVKVEFERLDAAGLFETRVMDEPVSSTDLDELYDCAFSWADETPLDEGTVLVQIFPYPRDQYPVMNSLMDVAKKLHGYLDPRLKE